MITSIVDISISLSSPYAKLNQFNATLISTLTVRPSPQSSRLSVQQESLAGEYPFESRILRRYVAGLNNSQGMYPPPPTPANLKLVWDLALVEPAMQKVDGMSLMETPAQVSHMPELQQATPAIGPRCASMAAAGWEW